MDNDVEETTQNTIEVCPNIRSQNNSPLEKEIPDFPADINGEVFEAGDNVTAVVGDLEIPSGTTVSKPLVVKGTLRIGNKCRMSKKIGVLGDVTVGSETVIEDSLTSGGNVVIGPGSVIHGSIKAVGRIEFKGWVTEEKEIHDSSVDSKEMVEVGVVTKPEKDESVISCRD